MSKESKIAAMQKKIKYVGDGIAMDILKRGTTNKEINKEKLNLWITSSTKKLLKEYSLKYQMSVSSIVKDALKLYFETAV